MEQIKRYAFEGEVIEVPLLWDEDTQTYVEDYKSVIENPIYSPSGSPHPHRFQKPEKYTWTAH